MATLTMFATTIKIGSAAGRLRATTNEDESPAAIVAMIPPSFLNGLYPYAARTRHAN
jgi:hypothetical protein